MFETDVVIAGGGMVGSALACALGQEGFSVALLEAAPPPRPISIAGPPSTMTCAPGTNGFLSTWFSRMVRVSGLTQHTCFLCRSASRVITASVFASWARHTGQGSFSPSGCIKPTMWRPTACSGLTPMKR